MSHDWNEFALPDDVPVTCLDCRFGAKESARGTAAATGQAWCGWVTAQDAGGDRMPSWAHEALMKTPAGAHGPEDRAEDCPAFEVRP